MFKCVCMFSKIVCFLKTIMTNNNYEVITNSEAKKIPTVIIWKHERTDLKKNISELLENIF